MLSLAITLQGFKTIAGQSGQVLKDVGCLETIQLEPGSPLDTGERFHSLTDGEVSRSLVAVADNHDPSIISHDYALRHA